MRTLPEPTRVLLVQMRFVARTFDRVTARLDGRHDAADIARLSARTVWQAINRIEDLARLVEELAPRAKDRCESCGADLVRGCYITLDGVELCRGCYHAVPKGAEIET